MADTKSLLFCCFDVVPGPNALSRRLTAYLEGLSEKFDVVVLSTKTPDHSHIERFHGARLLRVPVGSGDLASRLEAFDRAVNRQLESEEYALAHFFDPFGGFALAEAREKYGFRLVYDAQSLPSYELRHQEPALEGDRRLLSRVRRQEMYCLMNADAVICGSTVTRDCVQILGAPPETLHVLPPPVELSHYSPAAMGRPDGTPMQLIYLGSHLPYQGLPTLLRALAIAVRRADMHLTVVGPEHPKWSPQLKDLIGELKLKGKVELLPPVADAELTTLLAKADVGVAPAEDLERNRLQGGAFAKCAEYLAAGRPVLATKIQALTTLLPHDATAFFTPGDVNACAEALVQLAEHPARRVEMGKHSRQAATRFDAAAVRSSLFALYEQLLPRGKSASANLAEHHKKAVGTPDPTPIFREPPKPVAASAPPARRKKLKSGARPAVAKPQAPTPREGPTVEVHVPHFVKPDTALSPGPTQGPTELIAVPSAVQKAVPPPAVPVHKLRSSPGHKSPLSKKKSTPGYPSPVAPAPVDEPEEISNEEIAEIEEAVDATAEIAADEADEVDTHELSETDVHDVSAAPLLVTKLDPWLSQLVHGYCPPQPTDFHRPPPPTTFPGRDT